MYKNRNTRPRQGKEDTTGDVRALLLDLMRKNRDQIQQDIASLTPDARLDILTKILPYVLPKATEKGGPIWDDDFFAS